MNQAEFTIIYLENCFELKVLMVSALCRWTTKLLYGEEKTQRVFVNLLLRFNHQIRRFVFFSDIIAKILTNGKQSRTVEGMQTSRCKTLLHAIFLNQISLAIKMENDRGNSSKL